MPTPIRAGTGRAGRVSSSGRAQVYPDTTSGYGPTRDDSVGYNPGNPHAYTASQGAKAYSNGPRGKPIAPPIRGTE